MASVVVEFSASWRGSTVVDSGSDSRNREDTGAKNTFSMDVVVFVSDDGSNPTGNDARCGTCVRHPSFGGKVGDVDRRGWLRSMWRTGGFRHDRCWRERPSSAADRHELFCDVEEEVKWRRVGV